MAASNTPLIYVGRHRVLYIGPSYGLRTRRYGAAALLVAMDGPMRVARAEGSSVITTRVVLLPPQLAVQVAAPEQDRVAVLFLDVYQRDYLLLRRQMRRNMAGILCDMGDEDDCIRQFRVLSAEQPSPDSRLASFDLLNLPEDPLDNPQDPIDGRVVDVINFIRLNPQTEGFSTSEIARRLHLSVPRVVQLFRSNIGVSFGTYRNWHRVHCAVVSVALGHSFTRAAVDAGFVDLSHFCNTFKRMFGINASHFLSSHGESRFFIDPALAESSSVAPFSHCTGQTLRLSSVPSG